MPIVVTGAAEPGPGPVAGTGAAPFSVAGDRDAIDRLLVNLIDNAVRYAKSQVTVAVRREDAEVTLTVTDDGPGIPDAGLERAFDRFARLDDARSRDGDEGGGQASGWRSCARPRRPTAARRTWNRQPLARTRRGCVPWSACQRRPVRTSQLPPRRAPCRPGRTL